MKFFHSREIYPTNIGKNYRILLKTGLNAAKTASKILFYKTGKVTAALIGNKVLENIVTLKPVPEANSINVEKIVSPPKKR